MIGHLHTLYVFFLSFMLFNHHKKKLFSKKNANEYFETFRKNNLFSLFTVLEFCPIGYDLIKKNKRIIKTFLSKNLNLQIEDSYLKSQIVYLKKK